MRAVYLGLAASLGLMGCVTPQTPNAPGTCQAPNYQHLVGRPLAEFRAANVTGTTRVLGPNSIMTMDLLPWRMNVHHDRRQIITKIECS